MEFSDAVQIHVRSPSKRSAKGKDPEESDLTELEDLEKTLRGQPSPRRLRSKDRELEKSKGKERVDPDATPIANSKRRKQVKSADIEQVDGNEMRVIPMRKAKGKIANLKESDTEQDETEEEHDELVDDDNVEANIDEEGQEEEEVDELVSSASMTPPPESRGRRTPLRRRLRPRRIQNKVAYEEDAENEGDDEEEDENEEDEEEDEELEDQGEEAGEQDDGAEEEAGDEDDEATIAVEPRKLRNGKIVGEEDIEMGIDEDIGEEDEEDEEGDEAEEETAEEVADAGSIDIDAEGDTDQDEVMEDDGQ